MKSRDCKSLLRDTLLGEHATAAVHPPASALHALQRRKQLRRRARATAATTAALSISILAWTLARPAKPQILPFSPPPTFVVRTQVTPAENQVHTISFAEVVYSPKETPRTLVVHTRAGLFSPLSDEALLASLHDQAPVLIGAPGERRIVFAPALPQ